MYTTDILVSYCSNIQILIQLLINTNPMRHLDVIVCIYLSVYFYKVGYLKCLNLNVELLLLLPVGAHSYACFPYNTFGYLYMTLCRRYSNMSVVYCFHIITLRNASIVNDCFCCSAAHLSIIHSGFVFLNIVDDNFFSMQDKMF